MIGRLIDWLNRVKRTRATGAELQTECTHHENEPGNKLNNRSVKNLEHSGETQLRNIGKFVQTILDYQRNIKPHQSSWRM